MSYRVQLQDDQGYVYLHYQGVIGAYERHRAREEVFDLCRHTGLHRSLVDMRDCKFQLSHADAIRFSRGFDNANLPSDYRLACIISPGSENDNMVGQLISLNGINIKYFHSEDDALSWLTAR